MGIDMGRWAGFAALAAAAVVFTAAIWVQTSSLGNGLEGPLLCSRPAVHQGLSIY